MINIKVLQVISGNDNGGGGEHVLNLFKRKKTGFHIDLCLIGEGELVKKANERGVEHFSIENKTTNNQLVELINNKAYDVVNFHGARACLIHKINKRKIKSKTCVTIHSNYKRDFDNLKGIKKFIYTKLLESSMKSFNKFFVVSEYLEEILKKGNLTKEAYPVYNGVDISGILDDVDNLLIRDFNNEDGAFIFSSVARFHPIKNHRNMVLAFKKILEDGIKTKLLLIGDGELENEIKELCKELSIEDKVIMLGYKDKAYRYLPLIDVNLLTSFDEGGIPPLSVLEGFVFSKTSLVSELHNIKDCLGDGVYYINPNSVDSIYSAMKFSYEDQKREEKGRLCNSIVKENYSIEAFIDRYYKGYEEYLLGGNNEE